MYLKQRRRLAGVDWLDWGSQGVRVDDVLEFEEVVGVGEEGVVAVAAGHVLVDAVHVEGEGVDEKAVAQTAGRLLDAAGVRALVAD